MNLVIRKNLYHILVLLGIDVLVITLYFFPHRQPLDGLTGLFIIIWIGILMLILSLISLFTKKGRHEWSIPYLVNIVAFYYLFELESHICTYIYYGFWSYY
jgi:uncharacterized membrane protein